MNPKGLLLGVALSFCINSGPVFSSTPLDLTINESYIKTSSRSFIENENAMVPLRDVATALGCSKIEWIGNEKSVLFKDANNKIKVYVNSKEAMVNDKKTSMPHPVMLIENTTYISARFIGTALGGTVSWNEKTHTVKISKPNHTVENDMIDTSYTKSDMDWLAKIVHAEAQGESKSGKIAVANVVLNRKKSREFPNTIYSVIFDRQFGVQFTPVANGAIYNSPSVESYHAAKHALFGKNVAGESLYFCNPSISTNFWIMNNRPFYKKIGNHNFYL